MGGREPDRASAATPPIGPSSPDTGSDSAEGRLVAELRARIAELEARLAERTIQLAESEARFRSMADGAPALIWTTDQEGRVTFANRRYEEILGLPTEAMLGEGWRAAVPEEDLPALLAATEKAFLSHLPMRFEVRMHSRAGALHWSVGCHALHGTDPSEPASLDRWLRGLHPEDQPALERALAAALGGSGSDWNAEFRYVRHSDGAVRWLAARGEILRDPATGRAVRMRGVKLDVTDRRIAEDALRESEARLRLAVEGARLGTWEVDLTRNVATRSARTLEIFGFGSEAEFSAYPSWRDRIHPGDRAQVVATIEETLQGRQDGYRVEYRFLRPDGEWRWVESHGRVVARDSADGRPLRIAGITQDVTERRLAEERRALLAREVDHRAKNALAVVQAALRLTPREDADAFARAVEGRVAALARAQTLLAEGSWVGASLQPLLEAELGAFPSTGDSDARIVLQGPPVELRPDAVQALSMAVHELATNATKYGALSEPGGRLSVTWTVDTSPPGLLRIVWTEVGGPPVASPPARRGFGSRVLEAVLREQLGGTVNRRWEAAGLTCEIALPLVRILGGAAAPHSSGMGARTEAEAAASPARPGAPSPSR